MLQDAADGMTGIPKSALNADTEPSVDRMIDEVFWDAETGTHLGQQ